MSDRKKFKKKFKDKLVKFEGAAVDLSWKGSKRPEEFEEIEERYRIAKKHLVDFIMKEHDLFVMKAECYGTEDGACEGTIELKEKILKKSKT